MNSNIFALLPGSSGTKYMGEAAYEALARYAVALSPIFDEAVEKLAADRMHDWELKSQSVIDEYERQMMEWSYANHAYNAMHWSSRLLVTRPKEPSYQTVSEDLLLEDSHFYKDVLTFRSLVEALQRAKHHYGLFVFDDHTNLVQRTLEYKRINNI